MKRTIQEMNQSLNELLRGNFAITSYRILTENTHEFLIKLGSYNMIHSDRIYLYFTPYDSDKTLSQGLWNKGLLTT